jgi:hypothetical protein
MSDTSHMSPTSTSNSHNFVPEAVRNVLTTASDDDCVTVRYEGDEGPFDIQVANFPDGSWLNVCNFPGTGPSLRETLFGDPEPHPYAQQLLAKSRLPVDDHGPMFVVLELLDEDADLVIEDLRETARICGADVSSETQVKSQTLRPGGWRGWLLQKVQRGD